MGLHSGPAGSSKRIPGGAPGKKPDITPLRATQRVLRDGRFLRYLGYTSLTLVTTQSMLMAFVPLFMKEQVGLSERQIILLQICGYVAGLLSSYGELEHALSGAVEIRRFDPLRAMETPYPITTYQPLLWWVSSIGEAFEKMDAFVQSMRR